MSDDIDQAFTAAEDLLRELRGAIQQAGDSDLATVASKLADLCSEMEGLTGATVERLKPVVAFEVLAAAETANDRSGKTQDAQLRISQARIVFGMLQLQLADAASALDEVGYGWTR